MSEWSRKTLGDLIHVKHGFAFKGEHFVDGGDKLVLKPGNFPVGGGIRLRPGKDDYYSGPYPPEFELSPGDMVVVMTDLTQTAPILGSPAFIPSEPVMLHNQRLGLVQVKPGVEVDRRFLYYYMLSDISRSQIRATATGATVRHTAPERIYRVSVMIPPRSLQRVIGEVLGSIDELIENNRRRITTLEEMARVVYREWFDKFRYPGRGVAPLVSSTAGLIPSGWRVGYLGEDLPFRPFKEKILAYEGARCYLATADVSGLHGKGAGTWLEYADLPSRAQLRPGADTVFTARMSGYRKVLLYPSGSFEMDTDVLSSGFLGIQCDPGWLSYVAATVSDPAFEGLITQFATGATQVSLTDRGARQIPWLIPTEADAIGFNDAVAPLYGQMLKLRQVVGRLADLRDLLLPKLVTGQIDVSTLDLNRLIEGQVA